MFLKRLEIHGFKSFASKTTLEFSKGVIAIVGPNGSGKSNVADCLRWVLGEQSAKIIRGKKSDDVIFAGSDKKVRLGFAEVIATFDNSDRRIPVDASEVSIGRRIDRSGESEYLINGNKVRLLDVIDLVLKSNIGTSRYTVIGQGTIDQMILTGPAEIKNLIDEASGVKTYYIRREKTLRRLEQTAQNLMRAEDLMVEIEPRLKSLRRQAKKLEARAELEQELKLYQREFFGKNFWSLKTVLDGYAHKLSGLHQHRDDLEKQLFLQRKDVEGLESHSGQHNSKFTEVQEHLNKLQNQKNKLLEDLSLVRGKMQSQRTAQSGDAKSLQVEVHHRQQKISELKAKVSRTQEEKQKLEKEFVEQFGALEAVNKNLSQLYQSLNQPVSIDWQKVSQELAVLEGSLESFYSKMESSSSLEEVRQAAGSVKQSFSQFKSSAQSLLLDPQASLAKIKSQLDAVSRQKEELNSRVNELQLNLSKAKISLDFSEKELSGLEQEKLHLDLELKKAQSGSVDEFWQELTRQEQRIQAEVNKLGQEVAATEAGLKDYYQQEESRQKQLRVAENRFRDLQDQVSKIKDQESALNVEKAKYDTQMEVLTEEVRRILGEEFSTNIKAQPVVSSTTGLEDKILRLKNQLDTIGGMDELTLKEYQETEARYTNLSVQVEDLKKGLTDLRSILDELDEHIKVKFNESFHRINEKFEYYFRVLFNGGRAYLSVVKAEEEKVAAGETGANEDVTEEQNLQQLRPEEKMVQKYEKGASNIVGIDMKATPPGKKLSNIQALSGGERSLTSIALLCSLLTCFPSPFVVLDEVDAALDDANTVRFGQILGTLANQTQFLTITHNRETMAQATMLYGVTMGDDGVSKLLSVKLEQAKAFAK